MPSPTAALALCRAVGDGALLLGFGASLFAAAMPPPRAPDAGRRAGRLTGGAAPLALIATLLRLPAQAAALGEGWGDAGDAGTLLAVATDTAVGRAWAVQLGAALIFAAVALRRGPPARQGVAAGLAVASLALSGHAAALSGTGGAVAGLALAVHLLAGGAWIGSLPEVLRLMAALGRGPDAAAARALRRFSAAGHGAVALVIATGALDAVLIAGWPRDLLGTDYGRVLALKLLLAAIMAALALVNRYRLVPRLAVDAAATPRLLANTRWVLALGLAAVAASGLLGLLDPP